MKWLLIFLHIPYFFSDIIYIDRNSFSSIQDGSQINPYRTFTTAFKTLSTNSSIIVKSSSFITDIVNNITITFSLNITTTEFEKASISLNQNSLFLIKNKAEVFFENFVISRMGNQTINQVFSVNQSSLLFQNCTFKTILKDSILQNFIQLSYSQLSFISIYFDTLNSNFTSFVSASFSSISFSLISINNCLIYGNLLTFINTNMTIIGITLFNTTFVNGSFLFNDFNGVFFPTNIVFAQMQYTKSNQLLSNEKALIVYSNPVNYIMANFSFIQCNFSDISSMNPLISISKTWGFLHIKECFFSNNAGESQIYTEELGTLILSSVQCLFHNTNGITGSFLNGCFNLRTTMIRLIENLVIDRCVGVNLAGIKFFDNSTILAEMLPGVNQTGFTNFSSCNFTNNYIEYLDNGNTEIGTAIFVDSGSYMNFTNCLFQNNVMNTSETIFKNGGSCINSIHLTQKMRIFFSNFLSNVAKYYANCIMFIGNLIDVDSSLFKDNYPILSEDNLKNQENLGGVFYLLSETTIIKNSKFLNNCNFNGGALYINGNKNRALSNLLQSNNEWVNNTAIQNGGAIFFDYDFIILSANLSLELYQHNWAKESGGAIFTQFSSDSAKILLYKTTLLENLSGIGGALALTHLIGLFMTQQCNFIRNLASYMDMLNFLEGKKPASDDKGAGGALRIEGRIFTLFVAQKTNFIGNWAALRGGVVTGLPGNSTYMQCIFKENHAQIAGTFYVGTFHFLYLIYSQVFGDYADETGASMVLKEFCLCYVYNSYFQDCHSKKSQGVIVLSDEVTTYVLGTTFVNISSQEGSIFYVTDIKSSPFVIQNMNVINCYSFYGLISIYDSSNLAFVTSNFTNNTGRVYSFKNCIVVLIGNIILNNICTFQNEIEACFLYASDGSQIMVNYTVAANIMNIKQGGAIYTIDSTLLLYVFKLTNTSSYHYGGCVMAEFSNVIIMNSGFLEYGGGCLFIKGSNLTLLMNSFSNSAYRNKLLTYGSTLACVNCETTSIIGCQFIGNFNNTLLGGAMYFENDVDNYNTMLFLKGNIIANNYVRNQGGALYMIYQIGIITQNVFQNNSATTSGGAIYYEENLNNDFRFIDIKMNNFTNNQAEIEGGAVKYISKRPRNLTENYFSNNSAIYGKNLASYPIRLRLYNESKLFQYDSLFILRNEVSNSQLSQKIIFGLFDTDDQECILINTGQAFISAVEFNKNNSNLTSHSQKDMLEISGTLNNFITTGKFSFGNIQIKSYPANKTFNLTIITESTPIYYADFLLNKTPNEENESGIYTFVIPVYLRNCIIGEIYEHIYEGCYECEYSKYSFSTEDEVCNPCPDNAVCYGGKNISVYQGYWRSSITSINMIKCVPYAESCLGGFSSNCSLGYIGPLCQTCDIFGDVIYRKSGLFECFPCGDEKINIILLVLASVGIFGFYIIIIKSNITKLKTITLDKTTNELTTKSKRDMHLSIFFRIFLNYLQIVSLAQDFDLTWPDIIQNMFAIQYSLGNISQYMFSFDCLIKNQTSAIPTLYLKALLTALSPIIAFIFIIVFWILYKYWKKKGIKNDFITTLLISTYFIQPTIISMMAKILSCKEVDPDKYYITTFLYYQCYTEEHYRYVLYLALPLLIIWVGIYPFGLCAYLHRNRYRLNSLELRKKLGFIYNGYNSDVYYWEFIVMLRKITIIIIASFLKYNAFAQALVVLFVLGVSIYFQTLKKPFFSDVLNELEYRAIAVSLFNIYFGLFYYVTTDDIGKFLTILVIISSNVYFLSYWLLQVAAVQYDYFVKLLRWCPKLQAIVIKIKEKIYQLDQYLSRKNSRLMEKSKISSSKRSETRKINFLGDVADSNIKSGSTAKVFPKPI